MIKIDYPSYQPRIRKQQDKEFIFDEVRKQWVMLTPEEWVRQNFLQYLTVVKKYPASLIAVEKEIYLGDLTRRFDIVVYDRDSNPWMIVECKEMNITLSEPVLAQALRYNISLNVPFIFITNGSHCYGFGVAGGRLDDLDSLPEFTFGG